MKRKGAKQPGKKASGGSTPAQKGDECIDMPPLEDMRSLGQGSIRTSKEQKSEEKETKEVLEWQSGEPPAWLKFTEGDDVSSAYKLLGLDPATNDDKVVRVLAETVVEIQAQKSKNTSKEKAGAMLLVSCARSNSSNQAFKALAIQLYNMEANELLRRVRLPVPRGIKPGDPLLSESAMSTSSAAPMSTTDKARLVKENDELKTNIASFKADVKEAFQARDAKAKENTSLQKELAELKGKSEQEIQSLEEENAKLRDSNAAKAPSAAKSDKTDFVLRALSKQVKDLGDQLKEKNNQLGPSPIDRRCSRQLLTLTWARQRN
ncbi:uncharacterized protein JCM6883_003179 [Sporobolomyces salmoneus]|uniref:uncharacterized protein n=1 Tax=Sporobolomyces salmoneus TaxID=183962 RepID=UPI0031783D04